MRTLFRLPAFVLAAMSVLALSTAHGAENKPKFSSPIVTSQTPGHAVDVDVDITGAKQLYLVVTDADDGISADWADWAEPRLIGPGGEKKLSDLKWKSANSGWGTPHSNRNVEGGPLRINGQSMPYGIGTHSNSLIVYDLPPGYTRFKARAGIDNGGSDQGSPSASSVRFLVFTEPPPQRLVASSGGGSAGGGGQVDHDPAKATSYLDVAEGLEVTLFCSEPQMTNPTNIDIDPLGRVWVCDVQNYRGHNGLRKAGDRILVMQDTNGEGKADKVTTFYQGRDIDATMGVCLLGDKVIVSCSPNIWEFTVGADGKAAKKEALFTQTGNPQHDHGAHAFVFGPDGKLYWNFGNEGHSVHDKAGKPVVDMEGNVVNDSGRPYRDGMVFRCDLDGSHFENLANNFRNNYEVCVDSFGTMWQSDNDDDGNRGVRINYVMEHGNYGYVDEFTGAGWNQFYLGQPKETPLRHWHLSDPGVVPNLLQTGAGAPCGITINEGDLLPAVFHDQIIHADAGPSIVRAYPVTNDGAGYKAEIVDILSGTRNRWFRPVDVCIAPDGSLFVADWYDPGVGGHAQQDTDRGRIFRVAPKGSKYVVPKFDFNSIDGAIEALKNPCLSVRYMAWTKLHAAGAEAEPALEKLYQSDNPRYRARALWLLSKIEGHAAKHIEAALKDSNSDIRITALRAARELGGDVLPYVTLLVHDSSPQVRRECAIALRHNPSPQAADLWTDLALQNDGKDRWYVEALGIGADKQWDEFFANWLKRVGSDWNNPGGRDIVWRSRSKLALPLLAKLILDPATTESDRVRYFRAFDFQTDPSKQAVLVGLLGGRHSQQAEINALALKQLHGAVPNTSEMKAVIDSTLDGCRGTEQFVDLVATFHRTDRGADLLAIALENPSTTLGVKAAVQLLRSGGQDLFKKSLTGDDATAQKALSVLGLSQERSAIGLIEPVTLDASRSLAVRNSAVEALGHSHLGELALLDLASRGKAPVEIQYAVGKALSASEDSRIRATAAKYIKLPEAAGGSHLPPLAELSKRRGNVEHGKVVFNTTGTCIKCHTVNHVGKDVGPNLSEIGSKATRDFLYESILFPSAAIAHNYETWRLELASGNVVTGIIVSETKDAISIKTAEAIVQTYKPSDIENKTQLKLSLMPADLQKLMTTQDLTDVVEYLTTLKKAQ
jgi:putative membrane-bound dehydrogenase-like protein